MSTVKESRDLTFYKLKKSEFGCMKVINNRQLLPVVLP